MPRSRHCALCPSAQRVRRATSSVDGKTDAQTIYSITYGGDFYGTPYAAYNDGTHWVQLSAGGWANAKYLAWAGGAREQVCV